MIYDMPWYIEFEIFFYVTPRPGLKFGLLVAGKECGSLRQKGRKKAAPALTLAPTIPDGNTPARPGSRRTAGGSGSS